MRRISTTFTPTSRLEKSFFDTSLVIIAILLALFVGEALWVHATITSTFERQHAIRDAQVTRAGTLRLQLDEETGIRGFLATRRRLFLAPFVAALPKLPGQIAALKRQVTPIDPSLAAYAAEESRINRLWLSTVARPLIARPSGQNTGALMLDGKFLVDQFRGRDDAIFSALDRSAAKADQSTAVAIQRTVDYSIALGALLAIVLVAFSLSQARLFERMQTATRAFEDEKRIADALVQAFVQKTLPAFRDITFHATYVPAEKQAQIGGDWYDAFELPNGRIFFSIGDVAGHGIEAAVVMTRIRQFLFATALKEADPALVLAQTNEVMLLQDAAMVTAICGYIDSRGLRVSYATAGHPPPILARDRQKAVFLAHSGQPLGVSADCAFETFHQDASPGALLVLYTDGMLEYSRDLIAGERKLLEVVDTVVATWPEDPAATILERVFEGTAPSDDVAILAVRFEEPGRSREFSAAVAAVPAESIPVLT